MCDYSLCGLPVRLAVEGEELVTHHFSTGTMGLASVAEIAAMEAPKPPRGLFARFKALFRLVEDESLNPLVVCVPPGATLGIGFPRGSTFDGAYAYETVRFTQVDIDRGDQHRDAIKFKNGAYRMVHEFPSGIPVKVLSLASEGTEEQPRVRQFLEDDVLV